MTFRTLIVEDNDDYRQILRVILQRKTRCKVVGEASDGIEAVRRAEILEPDLILLDIGLPTLSGIEVARRIRNLVPDATILFVSQNSSPEIVEAVLEIGALGYLLKSDAAELPVAINTVLKGKQFISSGLETAVSCGRLSLTL